MTAAVSKTVISGAADSFLSSDTVGRFSEAGSDGRLSRRNMVIAPAGEDLVHQSRHLRAAYWIRPALWDIGLAHVLPGKGAARE